MHSILSYTARRLLPNVYKRLLKISLYAFINVYWNVYYIYGHLTIKADMQQRRESQSESDCGRAAAKQGFDV